MSHLLIEQRVANKPKNQFLTARTTLQHFSIITYLVDFEKLRAVIPSEFEIYTININGKSFGLVSAVTFIDKDFNFKNFLPFCKVNFPQTNYRAYIIDKNSKENCAWFFGTGIGSKWVFIPRNFWKMPWFWSKYSTNFNFQNKYLNYKIGIEAEDSNAKIHIYEDEITDFTHPGFADSAEAKLILTHPVSGYFSRSDGKIGKYSIWHPKMEIRTAKSITLYFEKFEKLGILTKAEMEKPYSILLTKEIEFIIDLPPTIIKKSRNA